MAPSNGTNIRLVYSPTARPATYRYPETGLYLLFYAGRRTPVAVTIPVISR
jgi:hypothetical protein